MSDSHLTHCVCDKETSANRRAGSQLWKEAEAWKALYEVEVSRRMGSEFEEGVLKDQVESLLSNLEKVRSFIRSLRQALQNKRRGSLRAWLQEHDKLLKDLCDDVYPQWLHPGYEGEQDV